MAYLRRLQLQNWRNLAAADIPLREGLTIFCGRNGQGKTSILEAIGYLALLRSFRTHVVGDLKRWGNDAFRLSAFFDDPDSAFSFSLTVAQAKQRSLRLNNTNVGRASSFVNRFACVPFVPEDMHIIRGGAAYRRRFLDILVAQCRPTYLNELQTYRETVESRNMLLRKGISGSTLSSLAAYDSVLVKYGARVEHSRREFMSFFQSDVDDVSSRLTEGSGSITWGVTYICPGIPRDFGMKDVPVDDLTSTLSESLARSQVRDARDGHTTVGPHRADISLTREGRALQSFGSEGQCRLFALILRFAQIRRIKAEVEDRHAIIALVDDVVGDLDDFHRHRFFRMIMEPRQVMMACTSVPEELGRMDAAIFDVEGGTAEKRGSL